MGRKHKKEKEKRKGDDECVEPSATPEVQNKKESKKHKGEESTSGCHITSAAAKSPMKKSRKRERESEPIPQQQVKKPKMTEVIDPADEDDENSWFSTLDPIVQEKIRSLKRKLGRREKKLEASKKDLETLQTAKGDEIRKIKESKEVLEKANLELTKEVASLRNKREPSGWAKEHKNSQGKRVPSKIGAEMSSRLQAQSISTDDYVEVKKGDFVRFLAGSRCLGYYAEAGTNILLPRNTSIPKMIKELAVSKAKESLKMENQKGKCQEGDMKKMHLFTQISTALHYSLVGDHQGPIYINGRPVELKYEWVKDQVYTAGAIMAEQPIVVREFLETAMVESGLGDTSKESLKKEAVVMSLKLIIQNNRKQGLAAYGSTRGRAQRKLTVPEEMWPGNDMVSRNEKLPPLPPLADERKLEGPLIGIKSSFPLKGNRKVKKGAKEQSTKPKSSSTEAESDPKGTAKKKALQKKMVGRKGRRKNTINFSKKQKNILEGNVENVSTPLLKEKQKVDPPPESTKEAEQSDAGKGANPNEKAELDPPPEFTKETEKSDGGEEATPKTKAELENQYQKAEIRRALMESLRK